MGFKVVFVNFPSHFLNFEIFSGIFKKSLNDCNISSQHCWVQHVAQADHHVAMCCDLLNVASSTLTIFKLEPKASKMSQQIGRMQPRSWERGAAKRAHHVAPNMVLCVVLKYHDRCLAGF